MVCNRRDGESVCENQNGDSDWLLMNDPIRTKHWLRKHEMTAPNKRHFLSTHQITEH